jgi:peptide/nickel transport system permease protein
MSTAADVATIRAERAIRQPRSNVSRALRPLLKNGLVMSGLAIVALMLFLAICAPLLAPRDPVGQDIANGLKGPAGSWLFGTDRFGRDILSRVILGSRISLWVAFASVTVAVGVGSVFGLLSGYLGGWVDNLISRIMDVFFSFPSLFNEGRTFLELAPWMSIFPGLAIMLAVLRFNLVGDGLRDVLDPKAR